MPTSQKYNKTYDDFPRTPTSVLEQLLPSRPVLQSIVSSKKARGRVTHDLTKIAEQIYKLLNLTLVSTHLGLGKLFF